MEFWINVIQTLVKAIFLAAVALGGIYCGKNLRMQKNAKLAQSMLKEENAE